MRARSPPRGTPRRQLARGLRAAAAAQQARRVTSCAEAAAGPRHVLALARRLAAPHGGERVGVGLELRVVVLLAQRADLGQPVADVSGAAAPARRARPRAPVPQLDGGVLHRHQVLDLVVEALADQPAAVRVRRVQQRGDEPVALVEVGLPVERVVLVGPRHVPDRGTREGHRRVAGAPWRAGRTRRRPT